MAATLSGSKVELRTIQYFVVFGQDPGIDAQSEVTGRDHADDVAARTERRQETCHKDIRVEDDLHRLRFSLTALISVSISSMVILSVPRSTDRR